MTNKNNSIVYVAILALSAAFLLIAVYALGNSKNENSQSANPYDLVGRPMPAFSLRDRQGAEYRSEDFKGKNTILFFNEGLMCYPGCWNQIVALAEDQRLKGESLAVFSIEPDAPEDWTRAIERCRNWVTRQCFLTPIVKYPESSVC